MGKRYTEEEKRHIQELAQQGHTDEAISHQLGRSTNAIRNQRHRKNIKRREKETIQRLNDEKQNLTKQTKELTMNITRLLRRREQLCTAIQVDDQTLKHNIERELIRLKNHKPELFQITEQEQINLIKVQLASSFLKWLIE